MEVHGILVVLVIGLLAGWVAGLITKGGGFGILMDIVLGVIGAFVGNFVFGKLGIITTGWLGLLLAGIVGAVILIVLVSLIRKIVR